MSFTKLAANILKKPLKARCRDVLFCVILLFVTSGHVQGGICDDSKVCHGRGGCYFIEQTIYPTLLSTKCVCAKGFIGRWCQFSDEDRTSDSERELLKDAPESPRILTDVSAISYSEPYLLRWKMPSMSEKNPVLYFAVRYRKVGNTKWKALKEILTKKNEIIYGHAFKTFYFNASYEVEIYAGTDLAIGRPTKATIHRPKFTYPEIIDVSQDNVGARVFLEHTTLRLFCKVCGRPAPNLTWYLNGTRLSSTDSNIFQNDEVLRINASTKYQGFYRCFAANLWGTVMSRVIHVKVTAPAKFLYKMNQKTVRPVVIGGQASFRCPPHTIASSLTYSWGKRGKTSENFDIEVSDRVWITPEGMLFFRVFKDEDVDLINKHGGIRCIINQTTSSGNIVDVSDSFYVEVKGHHSPKYDVRLEFFQPPEAAVAMFRGETLTLYCSAFCETRGKLTIQWSYDLQPGTRVNVSDFGRVFTFKSLEVSDAGRITCTAFNQEDIANERSARIETTVTLSVIHGPGDEYRQIPKEVFVYEHSYLHLGYQNPIHRNITWYFNGQPLVKHLDKTVIAFDSYEDGAVKMSDRGMYQFDVVHGHRFFTAAVYLHVFGVEENQVEKKPVVEVKPGNHDDFYQYRHNYFCTPVGTPYYSNIRNFLASMDLIVNNRVIVDPLEQLAVTDEIETSRALGGTNFTKVAQHVTKRYSGFCLSYDYSYFSGVLFENTVVVRDRKDAGAWSAWSSWSDCSQFCVHQSSRTRQRSCNNPAPSIDDEYCSGSSTEKQLCPSNHCMKKVPSIWSSWSSWTSCSKSCGSGRSARNRQCFKPILWKTTCDGKANEMRHCLEVHCPVNGKWSDWSAWGECSKSCGRGRHTRNRTCSPPRHGGLSCKGKRSQITRCVKKLCPGRKLLNPPKEKNGHEVFEKEIFRLPLMAGTLSVLVLVSVGTTILCRACRRKCRRKTNMESFVTRVKNHYTLFAKEFFDVEREPLLPKGSDRPTPAKKRLPTRKHRQQQAFGRVASPRESSNSSLLPKHTSSLKQTSFCQPQKPPENVRTPPPPPPPPNGGFAPPSPPPTGGVAPPPPPPDGGVAHPPPPPPPLPPPPKS